MNELHDKHKWRINLSVLFTGDDLIDERLISLHSITKKTTYLCADVVLIIIIIVKI